MYLASKGYKIFGHWRRKDDRFRRVAQAFAEAGIECQPVFVDLAKTDEVVHMCDQILMSGRELSAIINLAGGSSAYGPRTITPQNIVDTVTINLTSPMIIAHRLLSKMSAGSVIINTSALTGFHASWYPTDACFDASKGGIHRFTENMARELGPRTRVNAIVLGLSEVNDNYNEWRNSFASQIPMRRIAQPDDYVKCVDFFLNHSYVTGVCLPLDGGWYSYPAAPPFPSSTMNRLN